MVLLGPWLQTSSKWLCMNKQPMRDGALKEDAPFRKATNQMERFTEGSAKSCTLFPGSGRWGGGGIAGEQLQDLELNSLSQVVPRFGFSEIRHLVWPLGTHPSPSVVMGGDRTAIILPPCPVTSKQGGVMKRWEGTLSPWAERHWGVLRVLGINLEPSYGLRGRG